MINVFIADDHLILIDGIKSLLSDQSEIQVVGQAMDGEETISLVATLKVDVILLDIDLPLKDGIEVCGMISRLYPEIKVVALTTFNEGSFIQGMVKNGAKGYLLKNSGKEEILQAIQKVHSGETYYSKEVSDTLIASMMPGNEKKKPGFIPKLTRREKEVLQLIVQEYTTAEMAEKLFISLSTIETHRKNLLSKLGVRNSAGLVRVALEHKLLEE